MSKQNKFRKISNRIFLQALIACLFFGVAGSFLIYLSERRALIDYQYEKLLTLSSSFNRDIGDFIDKRRAAALTANRMVKRLLAAYGGSTPWQASITRESEGVYRSDDGISGAFLSSDRELTEQEERLFDRTGEIWEILSPPMLEYFLNFWIITPDNFVRVAPGDWALHVEANHNLLEGIYYYTADREHNPGGGPLWSPVYYDSILETWMTSLIIPLEKEGAFTGVTGSDLPINTILLHLMDLEERTKGIKFLIFDKKGNIILHPDYSSVILDRKGRMSEMIDSSQIADTGLADFIDRFNKGGFPTGVVISYDEKDKNVRAVCSELTLLGWRFVVFTDYREMIGITTRLEWKILFFSLFVSLTLAGSIKIITDRLFTRRINSLSRAANAFEEKWTFNSVDEENDEIGSLARSIEKMNLTISSQYRELKKTHSELSQLFDATTLVSIISTDKEGLIREFNKGAEKLLGYSREEIVNIHTPSIFHLSSEIAARAGELSRELGEKVEGFRSFVILADRRGFDEQEWTYVRKDGMKLTVQLNVTSIRDEGGAVSGYLGIAMDITGRKRQEREMNRLRDQLESVLDSIITPIIAVDGDMKIVLWNSAALKIMNRQQEDCRGKPFSFLLPDHKAAKDLLLRTLREKKPASLYKLRSSRNGRNIFENITAYPLFGPEKGAVINIEEITESVKMEEMIVQNEKMLSIGGLAAGMAHEINNPLAGIIQTLEVMERRISGGPTIPANSSAADETGISLEHLENYLKKRDIPRMMDHVRESGRRIAGIIENMLGFSRKSEGKFSSHTAEELLKSSLDLALKDFSLNRKYDFRNIEIQMDCRKKTPPLICEKTKIQQVLLNILQNGALAMTEGGTVNPRFTIQCLFDVDKNAVIINIKDNGPGMTEEVKNRIFEPFFTTREEGSGTGLGLSVSYFIIRENHGGDLTVQSEPDRGTTFTITLPVEKNFTDFR